MMDKIDEVCDKIARMTGLRVDWHAAGSMSYDAIIRVLPNYHSSKVIAFIYCWADPFKFCWAYRGDKTAHSLEEVIDLINKAEEFRNDSDHTCGNS